MRSAGATVKSQPGGGAPHPSTNAGAETPNALNAQPPLQAIRNSRGNRARAPPPQIQKESCRTCNMQSKRALQHATLTRGPPRNALVRIAWSDAPTHEFNHAHANPATERIQTIHHANICSETNSTMQKLSCSAVRAWHASWALGAGAYPRHAGQGLHAHSAKKVRRHPPHWHEASTGGTRQTPHAEPPPRAQLSPSVSSARAPPHSLTVPLSAVARPRHPTRV